MEDVDCGGRTGKSGEEGSKRGGDGDKGCMGGELGPRTASFGFGHQIVVAEQASNRGILLENLISSYLR